MADSPASAVSDAASFHTAASASSPRSHHPRIPLPPVLHLDPQSQTREQEQQQQRPRKRSKQRPPQSNDASTSTLPSTLPSSITLSNRRSSTTSMASNTSSTSASASAVVRAKPSKIASAAAIILRRPSPESIAPGSVTKSRPSKTSLRMSSAAAPGGDAPPPAAGGGSGQKKKKGAKSIEKGQFRAKGGVSATTAGAGGGARKRSTVAIQPQPPGSRQRQDDLRLEDAHTQPRRPLSKKNSVPGLAAGSEASAGVVPGPSTNTKRGKEIVASHAGSRRTEGEPGGKTKWWTFLLLRLLFVLFLHSFRKTFREGRLLFASGVL
ncbi:hypothetical protein CF319_g7552 [Tilletia indica]|nr:hypothetical protein CF319_g7552 [Tilletia indica]